MIAGVGLVLALVLLLWLLEHWLGPRKSPRVTELSRFPGNGAARTLWDAKHSCLPFEQRHRLPEPGAPRVKENGRG